MGLFGNRPTRESADVGLAALKRFDKPARPLGSPFEWLCTAARVAAVTVISDAAVFALMSRVNKVGAAAWERA